MLRIKQPITVLGPFIKNPDYTIIKAKNNLFALYKYNMNSDTCEKVYECQQFATKTYGIGPQITAPDTLSAITERR